MTKRPLILITNGYPVNDGEASFLPPELSVLGKHFDITIIPKYNGEKKARYLTNEYKVEGCNFSPNVITILKFLTLSLVDIRLWKEIFHKVAVKKRNIWVLRDILTNMMLSKNLDRVLRKVLSKYKSEDKPIVYSYWYDYSLLSATNRYAKKKKVKVVSRTHGYDLYNERCIGGSQVYKEQLDEEIDRLFFISEYGRNYYLNHFANGDGEKYFLAYIGTKKQSYLEYKKDDFFHIVSCAYMVPIKRIDIIIQALSKIKDEKIRWTHIGDGVTRVPMEQMAERFLGSKKNILYEFKGSMENDTVLSYYADKNIGAYILISETEGLPFSIIEAMAFGIPAIANNVGGIREIIKEDNGILLKEMDIDSIAGAILRLARMHEQEMEVLRRNAYGTWKSKFNGIKNSERLVKELEKL